MGPLLLFITTFIWGTAFLAQKIGGNSLGPFAITVVRNILGGLFLLALIAIRNRRGKDVRFSIKAGILCGIPLFAAMLAQQIGLIYTMPGISAFLTTNYVLFVPLLAALLTRRLPSPYICLCAIVSLSGTFFICIGQGDLNGFAGVGKGELWTVFCALLFSVQMLVVDHYAARCDLLVMSATQLFTGSVIGLPFLLLPSESAQLGNLMGSWLPLIYLGVFSSGIAYTLQNFGQSRTSPSVAALILSLESVFGALSGYVVLHDLMTVRQFLGCALVFSAAVAAQFAPRR